MKREILSYLVAPDTLEPLALEETRAAGDDVLEGNLRARESAFPLREGIPSFVSQEVAADQTVASFANKWDKHRYYRDHTRRFYTEWYLARFGFGDIAGLREFLKDKRFILDAGTGAGRDASNFTENCSAVVIGADTAWHALSHHGRDEKRATAANRVELVHADINRLPFPDEFFDFINCDQVIHHTPDPHATFLNLKRKLKRGGQIAVYVYRKKGAIREFTDDYVRERIKDDSFEKALETCTAITKLGKAFSDLKASVTIEEDIPILGITKGTYDVQRFLHWHVLKCFWNDEFDFFTNNVINADWYHPVYCFRYTPEELRSWFDPASWKILAWDEQEAGISCRAQRR